MSFFNGMLSFRNIKRILLIELNIFNSVLYNLKRTNVNGKALFCNIEYKKSKQKIKKMKKYNTVTDVNKSKNNNLLCKTETTKNSGSNSGGTSSTTCLQSNSKGYSNRRQEGKHIHPHTNRKVRDFEKLHISCDSRNNSNIPMYNYPIHQKIQNVHHPNDMTLHNSYFYRSFSDSMVMSQQLSKPYFHRHDSTDESTSGQSRRSSNSQTPIRKNRERDQKIINAIRSWQMTSLGKIISNKKVDNYPGFTFTVMSYNVLAQDLVDEHRYLYQNHNKRALVWDVRWENLLTEFKQLNPDIICLQEVQGSHIENYYNVLFKSLGYDGIYKQRTGIRTDGCAVYYKTNILTLIEHTTVEFNQPNTNILNRDNVAIIMKFSPKVNPNEQFVVATTHLLYNPKRQDVRLAQIQLLLAEIDRIAFQAANDARKYVPVVLTGDLNSTPESAVYEFINRGYLEYENLSSRTLQRTNSGKTGKVLIPNFLGVTDQCQHETILKTRTANTSVAREEELKLLNLQHSDRSVLFGRNKSPSNKTLFSSGTLSHQLAFKSVYYHNNNDDFEGTTYQDEWVTVDYIFYSGIKKNNSKREDKLKLLARYTLPTTQQLRDVHIPNFALGSDHLSLMAKFKLEY